MGGLGSGNWYRLDSKDITESQKGIDIRYLKKHGFLKPGRTGTLTWSCNGEPTGSVIFQMESERMILNYRYRSNGDDWKSVEQEIHFDWTSCNYGGQRTWFLCPHCGRRVALLYGAGKHFYCRHCYDLTYGSQQESRADRMMRKARKIRKRLGASENLSEPIFDKPKYMHKKTFFRLRRQAENFDRLGWLIMGQRLGMEF